jgi:hypothetical protein
MGCSPPRMSIKEAIFGIYINNLYCAIKGLSPFMKENKEEKRKEILNNFNCSVRKILGNKKFLMGEGEYISPDEKEERLQELCDEIMVILLNRRNDLKNMKISGDNDYLLFLDKFFAFLLSESNLPSFINLIFGLICGGTIFSKEGDYERDRKWLDSFEFKI